jgi:hypothetical protein
VARSRCEKVEQIRPGTPVLALLRSGPDPLGDAGELSRTNALAREPLLVVDRMAGHLADATTGRPVLIAVDDRHRADRISRFLVRNLIVRLGDRPLVWTVSGRTDDVGTDPIGPEPIPNSS